MGASDLTAHLLADLKRDEGLRLYAYKDSVGLLTIGYGRMIDQSRGGSISEAEAEMLLENDVQKILGQLQDFDWYTVQDDVRRCMLAEMTYNLGLEGLLHFPVFLGLMWKKDYAGAANELKGSLWARQVGMRADRIIKQIETGVWD